MSDRTASKDRDTAETQIRLSLDLDGGESSASTGVGFFDHMLYLLARHGRLGLQVEASGDLETGAHHTVEDVGIVLGQAIDVSGRPYVAFDAALPATTIAGYETELTEEFFRAVASNAKLTVHIWVRSGTNAHHMVEAAFKAFARALGVAVSIDPEETGVPSTKGTLNE